LVLLCTGHFKTPNQLCPYIHHDYHSRTLYSQMVLASQSFFSLAGLYRFCSLGTFFRCTSYTWFCRALLYIPVALAKATPSADHSKLARTAPLTSSIPRCDKHMQHRSSLCIGLGELKPWLGGGLRLGLGELKHWLNSMCPP
jgi:hypothetical protein